MRGLIVSSGHIADYELLKETIEDSNYIVCADGGFNHLLKINKFPDLVLGDLDSIGKKELEILKERNIKIEKFPTRKNETDTELCVNHLLEKGYSDINLMGVTGSRIDHTLANVFLLKKIYNFGIKGSIIDKDNRIYYTEDKLSIRSREGFFLSILPLSELGIEVSLEGFLYNLKKEQINFASTEGVSNEVIKNIGKITIHNGAALIIESRD